MERLYQVFYRTPQSFEEKVHRVRVRFAGDPADEHTVELLLVAQAKHEIAAEVGRPPDQVHINSFSLLPDDSQGIITYVRTQVCTKRSNP